SSVTPDASNPCLVALNRVEIVFFGPVDFFALRRFAEILLAMIILLLSLPPASPLGRLRSAKVPTQLCRLSRDAAYAQPTPRPLPVAQVHTVTSGINGFLEAIAQVRTVAKAPGGSYSFN